LHFVTHWRFLFKYRDRTRDKMSKCFGFSVAEAEAQEAA
jgi:hypothetical protein